MTEHRGVLGSGIGRIGAGFRELPSSSREKVMALVKELEEAELGGVLEVGFSGRDLFEVPINEGRIGMIVIGGLNPVAVLEENGIKVHSRALCALIDYKKLFHFGQFEERFRELIKATS
jgi:hypothetical protein